MSPLLLSFLRFLVIGLGGFLFLVVAGMSSQGGAILTVILIIPWVIITFTIVIGFLKVLIGGGSLNFSRTRAAVREGQVGVSYYVRSWGGDNIIVVDEAQRLLCANGEVIGFDAIRKLEWASDGTAYNLKIVLVSGTNPIRSVNLRSEEVMKEAFERLCNTLRFNV